MTLVMGVLNVTPDSFYDGGRWPDQAAAVAHGRQMVHEGAAIVDVGGESTRPHASPVAEATELERVVPVVRELARELAGQARISVSLRCAGAAQRRSWPQSRAVRRKSAHGLQASVVTGTAGVRNDDERASVRGLLLPAGRAV